jgi:SnoaL-like domain
MTANISPEDRFAIYDLLGRYSRALDSADYEGYAALFAPEGICEIAGEEYVGREAIAAYIKRLTGVDTWAGFRHHNTQILFEAGDGSRCKVSCYSMIMFRHRDGKVDSRLQGFYRDNLVKIEGLWYFAERRWEEWDPDSLESYRPAPR